MQKTNKTSWGKVAGWYDDLIGRDPDSFQRKVILPNIIRLLDPKSGEKILDLACGQGFFSFEAARSGAEVYASDISAELIDIAKERYPGKISFFNKPAHDISFLENESTDKVMLILASQNIENITDVWKETNRILKKGGELHIVVNHPAFRIPKHSSWHWDEAKKEQSRLVSGYISEMREKIDMTPGEKDESRKKFTFSFHRPLEWYFKTLGNAGFHFVRLEEWTSHKESEKGPRGAEENRIRKEIPMFMYLKAVKE